FAFIMVSIVGTSCLGIAFLWDYYYYSPLTPKLAPMVRPLLLLDQRFYSFETLRYKIFNTWYLLSGGPRVSRQGISERGYPLDRILSGPIYCGPSNAPCIKGVAVSFKQESKPVLSYRVIFIGSSQTVGAGAAKLEDTFFVRTHRYLSWAMNIDIESINISIPGARSDTLFENYMKNYLKFQPDIVVLNLSNNDIGNETFSASVAEFLKQNELSGVKAVLLEEANNPEFPNLAPLLDNHKALRT